MYQFALPILFALFVWWFSTGVVLYVVSTGRAKLPLMMTAATIILVASAWGLWISGRRNTVGDAYLAFTYAILVWGWAEITFLSGLITGIRPLRCPPGCTGRRRVGFAFTAIVYHELLLVGLAAAVVLLSWDGNNRLAGETFLVLWTMRLSAKLNLFFGVPILNDEFLPERLNHLKSYFIRGPTTLLFPFVVTAATVVTSWLVMQAVGAAGAFDTVRYMLLATLMGLAILEHWFMVVPLPVAVLWQWGMGNPDRSGPDVSKPGPSAAAVRLRGAVSCAAGGRADALHAEVETHHDAAKARQQGTDAGTGADQRVAVELATAGTGVLAHALATAIWRHP